MFGGCIDGATRPGRAEYVPVRCPGICQCLYEGAGLRDIAEWDVSVELVTRSPEQYQRFEPA